MGWMRTPANLPGALPPEPTASCAVCEGQCYPWEMEPLPYPAGTNMEKIDCCPICASYYHTHLEQPPVINPSKYGYAG